MDSWRTPVTVSLAAALVVLGVSSAPLAQSTPGTDEKTDDKGERREKMALTMRVSPSISFSPARVSARAELRGDLLPDDEARLYCASIEWDWGDGTRSESQYDCEPYEEGKSTIQRRFSAEHTYNYAGRYRILLRLKRDSRVLVAGNSTVQIRPGVRDWGNH